MNSEIPVWLVGIDCGLGHRMYHEVIEEGLIGIGMRQGVHYDSFLPFEEGTKLERLVGKGMGLSYQLGGWGKIGQTLYGAVRGGGKSDSFLANLAIKANKERFAGSETIAIASHSLAATGREEDYLVIGDPVLDPAAKNAATVFVPIVELQRELAWVGHSKRVVVAGFPVPKIVKDETYQKWRRERIQGGKRLTMGIHFNGQTPREHVRIIDKSLPDLAWTIRGNQSGLRTVIFTATNQKLADHFVRRAERLDLNVQTARESLNKDWDVLVLNGKTRQEAVRLAIETSPFLDFLVTMPKETMAWAACLPLVWLFSATNPNAVGCENYGTRHRIGVLQKEVAHLPTFLDDLVHSSRREVLIEPWEKAQKLLADKLDGGERLAAEVAERLKARGVL